MTEFELTEAQVETVGVLTALIGLSGVHTRPLQGEDVILDLLPAGHVVGPFDWAPTPFCVRLPPDGSLHVISDEEAGIAKRPGPLEVLRRGLEGE